MNGEQTNKFQRVALVSLIIQPRTDSSRQMSAIVPESNRHFFFASLRIRQRRVYIVVRSFFHQVYNYKSDLGTK